MPKPSLNKEQRKNLAELINIHNLLFAQFEFKYARIQRNKRLLKGDHWTEKEKKDHRKDFRVAYSIPLVATKYNRILGEQRNNRKDWKAFGRERGDELDAEVITGIFKYIDDINHFKDVESEIYQDGGKGYGVLRVDIDKSQNPQGEIILEKIPAEELMWDLNSKKYDLSDAQFMQRFGWFTRTQAKTLFEFDVNGVPIDYSTNVPPSLSQPKNYFSTNRGLQLVKIIWHYERFQRRSYLVKNLANDDLQEFAKKEEAESYAQEQLSKATSDYQIAQATAVLTQQPPPQMPFSQDDFRIIPKDLSKIKCTVWSATTILDEYEIDSNLFPYTVYFPLFDDGDHWSLLDLVHDPQRWFDRFASMIDKATVKNIKGNNYNLVTTKLDPAIKNNIGEEIKKLGQGGHILRTLDKEALTSIITGDATIAVQIDLLERMMSIIEDLLGGRAFQGLGDTSNETATGIVSLQKAGAVGAYIFLDNLRRWKQLVGEKILELLPEVYNRQRQIRIEGKIYSQQVLEVMKEQGIYEPSEYNAGMGYLNVGKDLSPESVDILVGEVEMTENIKQMKFMQLMGVNAQYIQAGMPPIPPEIWLPYTDLEPSEQQLLINWFKESQQQAAQQAEETKQVQQQQLKIEAAKVGVDNITKLHGALNSNGKEKKSPSENISFKDIPEKAQVQMLEQADIHISEDEMTQHNEEQAKNEAKKQVQNINREKK